MIKLTQNLDNKLHHIGLYVAKCDPGTRSSVATKSTWEITLGKICNCFNFGFEFELHASIIHQSPIERSGQLLYCSIWTEAAAVTDEGQSVGEGRF
jgi:hypothetical protein